MSNAAAVKNNSNSTAITRVVFTGVMAAIICVITIFRIPLGQSKVHFANSMCLLSGLLLGPAWGGAAAGLGSALYDVMLGGYGLPDALITFVSKFAMAFVTGILYRAWTRKNAEDDWKKNLPPLVISCVIGALTYVALYMLKSAIYGAIAGNAWAAVASKFPASIINAGAAMVAAPIFYHAVVPALRAGGILKKLDTAAK